MTATVDIFLPVFNEEAALQRNVPQIANYVLGLPQATRVIILDNASTDATAQVGQALAARYPDVLYTHLPRKGRGHALRAGWGQSTADIVAYMDIDLSTPLSSLPALLEPLLRGQADVAVGSRLLGSSSVRGRKVSREVLSRGYNTLLRFFMASPVRDAQCGFKAVQRAAFAQLAPALLDDAWFFDTELLLSAKYAGLRVAEVPVHWVDDPESTVKVGRTVLEDLRGMARLYVQHLPNSLFTRLLSFGIIGLLSTLGYWGAYWLLSLNLPAQLANIAALLALTLANTALNRRFTFRRLGPQDATKHYALGFVSLGLTWAFTAAAIWALLAVHPGISHAAESVAVTGFTLLATVLRYAVFAVGFKQRPAAEVVSAPHPRSKKEKELA